METLIRELEEKAERYRQWEKDDADVGDYVGALKWRFARFAIEDATAIVRKHVSVEVIV
jgi:hypothetical protein